MNIVDSKTVKLRRYALCGLTLYYLIMLAGVRSFNRAISFLLPRIIISTAAAVFVFDALFSFLNDNRSP